MLQVGIGIAFQQVSSFSNQVFLGSLTKAVAIKQEHVILALSICRFLFEIAPNMLKGLVHLTPMLRDLTSTVNEVLNMADLHLFILQVSANLIVNIAGMAQNEVFISSPELLAKGMLVVIIHI